MGQESYIDVEEAVRVTIESNASMVQRWMAMEPGSWGFLAGKAVASCRQRLGRRLTDGQRRMVWDLLWKHLCQLKNAPVKA